MTILMTLVGIAVFIISLFTKTFKVALKRLWMFILTGVAIDMLLISIGVLTAYVTVQY